MIQVSVLQLKSAVQCPCPSGLIFLLPISLGRCAAEKVHSSVQLGAMPSHIRTQRHLTVPAAHFSGGELAS